jgi:hypothetical protein
MIAQSIVGDRGRDTSCPVPTGWPRAIARSPAPTERSVRISRTTLVRRCFTARRLPVTLYGPMDPLQGSLGSSSLCRLVRPYKLGLNLTALPCSHEILWLHAGGTNPGIISGHLPCRIQSFCLPRYGIGSATSTTIDFGAILPFTVVPACNLPVYPSQWPLPDITQDLVRGCELGFAAVSISGN